jgi:hypothetical protein
VAIGDVGVGTSKAGINGRLAYIDSGTSFIFGPPEDIKKFHALIPGATSGDGATYTVPCDTTDSAFFTFGSNTYSISPKDWVSPKVNGVCTSNFYGVNVVSETSWLVGDVFLKNVYAVFDYDKTRLGKRLMFCHFVYTANDVQALHQMQQLLLHLPRPLPPPQRLRRLQVVS